MRSSGYGLSGTPLGSLERKKQEAVGDVPDSRAIDDRSRVLVRVCDRLFTGQLQHIAIMLASEAGLARRSESMMQESTESMDASLAGKAPRLNFVGFLRNDQALAGGPAMADTATVKLAHDFPASWTACRKLSMRPRSTEPGKVRAQRASKQFCGRRPRLT